MKGIWALIRPFKLDAVKEAINELGIQGMTISEHKGCSGQESFKEIFRGVEYTVPFAPKIGVFVCIKDEQTKVVLEAIREAALTGKCGDGKIFVYEVEKVVRIRTGEENDDAL